MEDRQTGTSVHRLSLNGRKKALVTGVKDVLSFDANEVLLETFFFFINTETSLLHFLFLQFLVYLILLLLLVYFQSQLQ